MPGGINRRNEERTNMLVPDFVRPQWTLFPVFNVKGRDFGATGDGTTDDRVAIQRAIDAADAFGGGIIFFPPGVYRLAKNGLVIPLLALAGVNNIWLLGSGIGVSVLQRAAGTYNNDTHMILIDGGSNITISDLTLDGNRANCTDSDQQRHGLYIGGLTDPVDNVRVERVGLINMRGDGSFMIGATGAGTTTDIVIQDCDFFNNQRAGIAMQSGCQFVWILNNRFEEITGQSIDNEATGSSGVSDVWIIGNKIYHNNYTSALAMALGGAGSNYMERAYVAANEVYGGSVNLIHCRDMDFVDNRIYGATETRPITIQSCEKLRIRGGYVENNRNNADISGAILGQTSLVDVSIEDVHIVTNTAATIYGVFIELFTSNLHIKNCTVVGAGANDSVGVYVSIAASNDGVTRYDLQIDGNDICNFEHGVTVRSPNSATKLNGLSVCNNILWDSQATPTQTVGIELTSGNNANFIENQSAVIMGNSFGRGITFPVSNPAAVTPICIGGVGAHNVSTAGYGVAVWECIGTPEGAVAAGISSAAHRSDGGAGTCLYIKETSPTATTGWVGK